MSTNPTDSLINCEVIAEAGIEPTRRAQTLSLPEWAALYEANRPGGEPGG